MPSSTSSRMLRLVPVCEMCVQPKKRKESGERREREREREREGERERKRKQDTRIFRLTTWFNNVANNFAVNLHVRNANGVVRVLCVCNNLLKNLFKG